MSITPSCNHPCLYQSLSLHCEHLEDDGLSLFSGFPALSRGPGTEWAHDFLTEWFESSLPMIPGLPSWLFSHPVNCLSVRNRSPGIVFSGTQDWSSIQFIFILFWNYLFIWLCQVLVVAPGIFEILAACRIFSCEMWNQVPWWGMEPGPPALGVWGLSHWTTREVPQPTVEILTGGITLFNPFEPSPGVTLGQTEGLLLTPWGPHFVRGLSIFGGGRVGYNRFRETESSMLSGSVLFPGLPCF